MSRKDPTYNPSTKANSLLDSKDEKDLSKLTLGRI
jgi:hypothetical protein